MDVRAGDEGARRHWKVGVCRRHVVPLRRLRRQRQRHTAAIGDSALDNGARARCADALARVVRRPSPPASYGRLRLASAGPNWRTHGYAHSTGCRLARGDLGRLHRHLLRAIFRLPPPRTRQFLHSDGGRHDPVRRTLLSQQRRIAAHVRRGVRSRHGDGDAPESQHPARGGRAHAQLRRRACSRS